MPVIAGAGSNNTAEAIDLARFAEKAGADAVLIVTPYYNKPTQEGLYQHYKAINDAVGIPIIIYNIPGRSVIDMSVETMARLFELKNIVGVKDATGNIDARQPAARADGPGLHPALGRGRDRARLQWPMAAMAASRSPPTSRRGCCAEFQEACLAGDYAAALGDPGPADAAPHRAVPRAQPARRRSTPRRCSAG